MADNKIIFDAARRMISREGFNKPLVDALDAACAKLLTSADNAPVFDALRGHLRGAGFMPGEVRLLDTACAAYRAAAAADPTAAIGAGIAAVVQDGAFTGLGNGTAELLATPPAGDDRYLPLFQRLAAASADPAVVQAMARSFAAHAPAYGQDRTKARIADFVAQISNETGGFTRFEEDLRYRAATMLRQWPTHFTTATAAASVGKPVEIASRAYGGRMGNAPYPSRDGYDYRGRGALQLTGRAAYRLMGERLGLPLEAQPALAADPAVSVQIALEFYKENEVNAAIDAGNVTKARGITNGGSIGLDEVNRRRTIALQVLA